MPKSRSSLSERATANPIVVLIAVSAFGIGISIYAGYTNDLLDSTGSEEKLAEATITGVYDRISERNAFETSSPLADQVTPSVLPQGRSTYITITYVNEDGEVVNVDGVSFEPDGSVSAYTDPLLPDDLSVETRPIAIRFGPSNVRGGKLRIGVSND